jgi:hypothetical protein
MKKKSFNNLRLNHKFQTIRKTILLKTKAKKKLD